MQRRSRLITLAAALVALAAAPAAGSARPASRQLVVPAPTGSLRVGTATIGLVDRSRRDPFAKGRQPRRILAQVYYPAATGGSSQRYLPASVAGAEASASVPARALAGVRTNAAAGARPLGGRFPVLVAPSSSRTARSSAGRFRRIRRT